MSSSFDTTTPTAGTQQIQLLVSVQVKPGMQPQAQEAMARLVEATHREDRGCLRFEIGIDAADDTHYIGYEIWASQADLDLHSKQTHVTTFLANIRAFVVDPEQPLHASRYTPMMPVIAARYE